MSDLFNTLDEVNIGYITKTLSPLKQKVVCQLIEGSNFNKIGKAEGLKPSQIYKLKEELKTDLEWLRVEYYGTDRTTFEDQLFDMMREGVNQMNLSRFVELYLQDYSRIDYSSVFNWEENKSVLDRNIVVIVTIIKILFVRSKPIVIDYYYQDRKRLVDLIKKFKEVIKSSPIIRDRINICHTDADLGIKLKDDSQVRAIWTKGRKPSGSGIVTIFDDNNPDEKLLIPKISYIS